LWIRDRNKSEEEVLAQVEELALSRLRK